MGPGQAELTGMLLLFTYVNTQVEIRAQVCSACSRTGFLVPVSTAAGVERVVSATAQAERDTSELRHAVCLFPELSGFIAEIAQTETADSAWAEAACPPGPQTSRAWSALWTAKSDAGSGWGWLGRWSRGRSWSA
eukprot:2566226-Rhodomonas_salina.3